MVGKHHGVHIPTCRRFDTLDGVTVRFEEDGMFTPHPVPFLEIVPTIALPQCEVGSVCFVLAAWIRYAGSINSLPPNSAYALLILAQVRLTLSPPFRPVNKIIYI